MNFGYTVVAAVYIIVDDSAYSGIDSRPHP